MKLTHRKQDDDDNDKDDDHVENDSKHDDSDGNKESNDGSFNDNKVDDDKNSHRKTPSDRIMTKDISIILMEINVSSVIQSSCVWEEQFTSSPRRVLPPSGQTWVGRLDAGSFLSWCLLSAVVVHAVSFELHSCLLSQTGQMLQSFITVDSQELNVKAAKGDFQRIIVSLSLAPNRPPSYPYLKLIYCCSSCMWTTYMSFGE